ncbi:hypothetical protein ACLOJK_021037 [Asimina triloba]
MRLLPPPVEHQAEQMAADLHQRGRQVAALSCHPRTSIQGVAALTKDEIHTVGTNVSDTSVTPT